MMPMMSNRELALLEKYINKNSTICEYGSGGSTSWLSDRSKLVCSIEHNESWYKRTLASLENRNNANVFHVPSSISWNEKTEGTYEEFIEYVNKPGELGIQFNFFLVDGRARVACTKMISEKFSNSIVAFHDYTNRAYDEEHNYSKALDYLTIVETIETLAIMKKKE